MVPAVGSMRQTKAGTGIGLRSPTTIHGGSAQRRDCLSGQPQCPDIPAGPSGWTKRVRRLLGSLWMHSVRRDNRADLRRAQQALIHAGYPHGEAWHAIIQHLRRVRSAFSARRHVLGAGFATGVAMAVVTMAALVVLFVMGGLLAVAAGQAQPDDSTLGFLLEMLRAAATTAPVLGVAGAGLALVDRARWRHAGALRTFAELQVSQLWLLVEALVWAGVLGGVALLIHVQIGHREGLNFLRMAVSFGILGSVVYSYWFRRLYPWMLLRLSPVDAAAQARPVIELEVALALLAERDAQIRASRLPGYAERWAWAEGVLAEARISEAERRRRAQRRLLRRRGSPRTRQLGRALLGLGITAAVWGLVRWFAWWQYGVPFAPLVEDAWIDALGLGVGLILGAAAVWYDQRSS